MREQFLSFYFFKYKLDFRKCQNWWNALWTHVLFHYNRFERILFYFVVKLFKKTNVRKCFNKIRKSHKCAIVIFHFWSSFFLFCSPQHSIVFFRFYFLLKKRTIFIVNFKIVKGNFFWFEFLRKFLICLKNSVFSAFCFLFFEFLF